MPTIVQVFEYRHQIDDKRILVARGVFRREDFMWNGCVESNRFATTLDCMIRRADFVAERSVDSKQLAIIINLMMNCIFDVVERDATTSLC